MSKNIYRVNKKSDLDDIMKNNLYKPICICFLKKSKDLDLWNNLSSTLLTISKINTYSMNILIDFDNFVDDFNGGVGYFDSIKNNTPYFMAFFKGKTIAMCDNNDNFIPIVINHLEQIHSTYVNKLLSIFDNSENNNQNNENNENNQKSTIIRKIIIDEDLENDTNNQDIRTNLTIEDMLNIEINKKQDKKLDKNDNLLINDTEIDMSNNNYIKNHLLNNATNKKSNNENISLSIDQFELKKPDTHYMCNIF